MRILILIALIGLSACSHREELAVSKGPIFPLNTDRWHPAPGDLDTPKPIGPTP